MTGEPNTTDGVTLKRGDTVLLLAEDVNAFIAFKRHRDKFLTMLSAGVFELDHGQVEMNMHNGTIQTIHIHRMTYKRAQ